MAHGFLSYQDTRGEVDYLGGIINAVKKYLDNREKKEKVADIVASKIKIEGQKQLTGAKEVPSIHGTKQKLLTGGSFSRLLSSPQLSGSPGSGAVNPTVMGGALANIGFAGKPLKPEGFASDQVIDVTAKTMAYGTEQIVQAVDRLTFVNIQLLAAVRQQTALVNRDITRQRARNEENLLEKTINSSGNSPYEKLKSLPAGGGRGNRGGGGFSGGFLDTAQTVVKSAPQAAKTARAVGPTARAAGTAIKSAASNAGGAIVKAGKFLPDIGKLAQNSAKFLGTKVSSMRALLQGSAKGAGKGIVKGGAAHATINAMMDMAEAGFLDGPRNIDRMSEMLRGYGSDIDKQASRVYAGLADDADFIKIMQLGGYNVGGSSDEIVDVLARPVGETADLAQKIPAEDLPKLAAMRTASLDNAGLKAAEIATDQIVKKGTKEGLRRGGALSRMMVKQFGAAGTKSILKKIPVVAGVAGILFGIQRAIEGDFFGAGLEITSGILGATGVGAPLGLAIDGFLLGRDLGMVPMAKGGILTRPTPVVAGEAGAEGIFPLEGSQGRKTFRMFGDAFIDAQVRRKKEVAQVQAEGLKLFANKRPEYMKILDMLNPFNWGRDNNGGGNPQTPPLVPPPPLPSSPGGSKIKALRNFIGRKESGNDYSKLVGGAVDPSILSKSVAQLTKERGGLFAMGRYQIQMRTANEMLRNRGIDPATFMFDQAGQDSIFNMLLERRKYGDFLSGKISKEQFGRNLAQEWAALPYSENNSGYYDGVGSNRSLYKWNDSMKFLEGLKNMGDQSSNINSTSMQTAMASMPGTTVINNTYVTGDAKSSGGNAPAAVPIGIGSRDTGTSAFSDLSIRTLV